MKKPTPEERIKAYTVTAGGCHACYAANPIPMTAEQVAEMLISNKGKKVKITEDGIEREK